MEEFSPVFLQMAKDAASDIAVAFKVPEGDQVAVKEVLVSIVLGYLVTAAKFERDENCWKARRLIGPPCSN